MDTALTRLTTDFGLAGIVLTVGFTGVSWIVKRLFDQQQKFFDQQQAFQNGLLTRLDTQSEKLSQMAESIRDLVVGQRGRA